ncbi:MAG: divalent metal cation transporter [Methanosarcina barkeri]|nr:divalent metal cation transporter [Methanosarcina sp. ERenArc_MAG2]
MGTGLLAVPVLAGASAYAVAETAGLKEGLGKKLGWAPGFYAVIAASTVIGMSLNWLGVNPMRALYYAAALNGLATAPVMALVIIIANRKDIIWASSSIRRQITFWDGLSCSSWPWPGWR